MRLFTPVIRFLVLAALLQASAQAAEPEAVSADTAAQAIAQGAVVADVRNPAAFAQGHLPNAASLPADAAGRSVAALERLLSDAGVDVSRTVVVVGEAGDANAQALWQTLSAYATGRVLWLVGGTSEWQLTGRSLQQGSAVLQAVPQRLVRQQAQGSASARMAGASVRAVAAPEPKADAKLSAL